MGREIRRVPPNWKHPLDFNGEYLPLCDLNYEVESQRWVKEFYLWVDGNHPKNNTDYKYFWEYEFPPDENRCRPYTDEEATWYQVYETISEGTPMTPPFETQAELVEYLSLWDQQNTYKPPPKETIEKFVYEDGRSPFIILLDKEITSGIAISGLED